MSLRTGRKAVSQLTKEDMEAMPRDYLNSIQKKIYIELYGKRRLGPFTRHKRDVIDSILRNAPRLAPGFDWKVDTGRVQQQELTSSQRNAARQAALLARLPTDIQESILDKASSLQREQLLPSFPVGTIVWTTTKETPGVVFGRVASHVVPKSLGAEMKVDLFETQMSHMSHINSQRRRVQYVPGQLTRKQITVKYNHPALNNGRWEKDGYWMSTSRRMGSSQRQWGDFKKWGGTPIQAVLTRPDSIAPTPSSQSLARYPRVMEELRTVPAGALNPAFPGGQNYRASIRRLERLTHPSQGWT